MSLPGSSETINTGGVIATHTVGGKEYQTIIQAGPDGHLIGSRSDCFLWFAPATNANARILGDIFNTGTSPIRVRGIWITPTFTAVTGAQIGWAVTKTNAIGTGGTAVTPVEGDSATAAWPAAATARANPTGGATESARFFEFYTLNEETNAGFATVPLTNILPQFGDRTVEIVLNQNQGIAVRQIVANTVGLTGMLIYATYDN